MGRGRRPTAEGEAALGSLRSGFETPPNGRNVLHRRICAEAPLRPGFAKDIPPLTGDEVRVRTGRRMFGGKGVVQAAGEPVIGRHSCCVKLIESERLEPVFLFRYLSINYLCSISFLLFSLFIYERSIQFFGPFKHVWRICPLLTRAA